MVKPEELKFDEKGLIPAIVVDSATKEVLTLAYMSRESLAISLAEKRTCFFSRSRNCLWRNRESLAISLAEKRTCFFSRSRNCLWRKGETSGNYQDIVSITADCDRDALVVEVTPYGPACHLGTHSCFTNPLVEAENPPFSTDNLYALLQQRKKDLPEGSYTTYLFQKGLDKILKKIGEESTEVIIAGKAQDKAETIYEIADLMYHTLVLMVESGITPEEIRRELASRHIIDHKVKQEKMTAGSDAKQKI